jgi:4,5-DOPA dioxygenase extradiol
MNELNEELDNLLMLEESEKMPVLFVGHGSPMIALEENEFVDGFRTVANSIVKPTAILCISAHWFIRGTKVTAMENPKTIHDFGGFPDKLYEVQYPAKGHPKLAKTVKQILSPVQVELDKSWGLDHGAWTVIKHFYPKADVPIVELSIDYTKQAEYHYQLAKKLGVLRRRGVLIMGSGNIIHNLNLVDFRNFYRDDYGYDWAKEAKATMNRWILDDDHEALINYQKQSKAIQMAIPSPDHFIPLIYILGLKEKNETVTLFNDKLVGRSLSMTSMKIY